MKMHRHISVFSNPITEKRFLRYLEEKQKRDFESFKRSEERINGDNLSEQIINTASENYDNKKQAER